MQDAFNSLMRGVIIGLLIVILIKVSNLTMRVERIDHEWTTFYKELCKLHGIGVQK